MTYVSGISFLFSCPAHVSIYQGARAMAFGVLTPQQNARVWYRRLWIGIMMGYLAFSRFFATLTSIFLPWKAQTRPVFDCLATTKLLPKRMLFLYSDGDEVNLPWFLSFIPFTDYTY